MQQTRQRDSALNHSPRIRVHLLSRPSESHQIVQFYEKDEFGPARVTGPSATPVGFSIRQQVCYTDPSDE